MDLLRLLRLGHSRSERECDNESNDPNPFWIFDFGPRGCFWIVKKNIQPSHPSFIHTLFLQRLLR
jgi:hypothetical protein